MLQRKMSSRFFQLTTSRGDRQVQLAKKNLTNFFNSRPLVEIDITLDTTKATKEFSTHDLSWRSTALVYSWSNGKDFSTHDLSWRSTACAICFQTADIFQLTTSRGDRRLVAYKLAYDKFFQLTTSRGDRRVTLLIR